jgi:hypothetical protein
MPMRLMRRPRSPRVLHKIIRDEVRAAYHTLANAIIATLLRDIQSWSEQPEFKKYVAVGKQRWWISIKYDQTTKIGMIYYWVDKGTGERGGGEPYDIFPVEADQLTFTVPHIPKTVPTEFGIPGIVLQDFVSDSNTVHTNAVLDHPGIFPRNFTQSLQDYYMYGRRPGGFRSVTDAAIKRGARKIGS